MFYGLYRPYNKSFQRRPGQCQVKKYIFLIFKCGQKVLFLFLLRNLMVSFVFAYDTRKLQKITFEKVTS